MPCSFNVRYGKSARRKSEVAPRAFASALSSVSCSAPRSPSTGSGPGRAGSSDNAALCPGQTIGAPAPWDKISSSPGPRDNQACSVLYPTGPTHRLPRHIIGRYPTPPPARARRPSWFISTGLVIKLERVAQVLGYISRPLRASRAVQKSVHIPRRAPLIVRGRAQPRWGWCRQQNRSS